MIRPLSMTITRSQSFSMSPMSCVVRMTVLPCVRLISRMNWRMNWRMCSLATTSSPIVGSSRKMKSGSCSIAQQKSARMRCPRLSCRTATSMNSSIARMSAKRSSARS